MKGMKKSTLRTLAATVAVLCLLPAAGAAGAGPGGRKASAKKDELPKFSEVTKGMEVKEGFFTLYYDKKKDTLLGQIPKSLLNKPFLLSVSISKGPTYAGWMMGGGAVYWERHNNQLVLMESDTRYKKGKGSTVEDVIGRTYTDAIIKAVKVQTEAPGGDPVIDLGDLLKSDIVGLGDIYGRRRMDKSLTRWSTFKAFPNNVELAVDAALMGKKPNSGGLMAAVFFSLSKLPDSDYKPREADDRIGYFLTAQKDWTSPYKSRTVFKRYIHRWNLLKQDPEADESPVAEPIVFYIEKTVPIPYRQYVREGILEWNKAFERCGLLDAVQVRQQTATNEFKDLDPEDVRYNFFRWIVSGRAFAMGPSRVNPFTGQILDADIIFDDSMARYYVQDYKLMGARAYDSMWDPVADAFYANYPEYRYVSPLERLTPTFNRGLGQPDEGAGAILEPVKLLWQRGEPPCQLAGGIVEQLAFSQLLAAGTKGRDLPQKFIGQVIKEVVMHEVGHTLGLRHNFKASTWRSMSDIASSDTGPRPLTGSVMDYNPTEFKPTEREQGNFVTPTIGPYDYWAIEYGYRPFMPGGKLKSEKEMLKSITDRVAQKGLAYATDEDTSVFGPDPYVNRFDNGDDPIRFAQYRMKMVNWLKKDLVDRAVQKGESYARLRRGFNIVLGEYSFAARIAARLVGGQSVNRDHKGDPGARDAFVIVPADKQRDALSFLGKTVFSDQAYQFSPDILNKLGAGRFWHWDSDQLDFDVAYNLHDRVLAIQSRVLTILMNPMTVNRIYDAELKIPADEDAFTVDELFSKLTAIIWSELDKTDNSVTWTNRHPRISSFRRNLQREYLRRMIAILLRPPGRGLNADAHAVVRLALKKLRHRIDLVLKKSRAHLDAYTMAHLDESQSRIAKALEAEFIDGASGTR